MTPIEDEQPSEEQSAQVGEVRYMVGRQTGNGTQAGKEFDERIYNNERTRAYGKWDKQDIHRYIGIQPSKSEENSEDSS